MVTSDMYHLFFLHCLEQMLVVHHNVCSNTLLCKYIMSCGVLGDKLQWTLMYNLMG